MNVSVIHVLITVLILKVVITVAVLMDTSGHQCMAARLMVCGDCSYNFNY